MSKKEHLYYAKYTEEEINSICRRALRKWGITSQVLMCIEECSELIRVLAKSDRNINGSTVEEIASEIADVNLMIRQIMIAFKINDVTVASIEEEKLDRLKRILES